MESEQNVGTGMPAGHVSVAVTATLLLPKAVFGENQTLYGLHTKTGHLIQ